MHKKTKQQLDTLWRSTAHAIILSGPTGIGLSAAVVEYTKTGAATVLWTRPQKDGEVEYEKGSITVTQIRELYELLRTKDAHGRIVVIDAAERMAEPAQNAFLKLLEEPPEGVRFVLLTHAAQTLLPTIRSRAQRVDMLPIEKKQSDDLLDDLRVMDPAVRAQLLFIAEGLPAELHRLASNADAFAQRAGIVRDARTLLSGSPYERLKITHEYRDTKSSALLLVDDALKQLRLAAGQSGDAATLARMDGLVRAYDSIRQNGNIRLQLAATLML